MVFGPTHHKMVPSVRRPATLSICFRRAAITQGIPGRFGVTPSKGPRCPDACATGLGSRSVEDRQVVSRNVSCRSVPAKAEALLYMGLVVHADSNDKPVAHQGLGGRGLRRQHVRVPFPGGGAAVPSSMGTRSAPWAEEG